MPILASGMAGYLYGVFGEEGITTSKLIIGAVGIAGAYYLIKKASK